MQDSLSANVLSLDRKDQSFEHKKLNKKDILKPDYSKDCKLTDFGKATLIDRYLLPGEKFQDMFLRVSKSYADDDEHAKNI